MTACVKGSARAGVEWCRSAVGKFHRGRLGSRHSIFVLGQPLEVLQICNICSKILGDCNSFWHHIGLGLGHLLKFFFAQSGTNNIFFLAPRLF